MAKGKRKASKASSEVQENDFENAEGAEVMQSADADESANARMGEADFNSVKSAEASVTEAPLAPMNQEGVDKILSKVTKEKKPKSQKVRGKDMKFN